MADKLNGLHLISSSHSIKIDKTQHTQGYRQCQCYETNTDRRQKFPPESRNSRNTFPIPCARPFQECPTVNTAKQAKPKTPAYSSRELRQSMTEESARGKQMPARSGARRQKSPKEILSAARSFSFHFTTLDLAAAVISRSLLLYCRANGDRGHKSRTRTIGRVRMKLNGTSRGIGGK